MQSFINFIAALINVALLVCWAGIVVSFIKNKAVQSYSSLALALSSGVLALCAYLYSLNFIYAAWGVVALVVCALSGPIAILVGIAAAASQGGVLAAGVLLWPLIWGGVGFYRQSKI